MTLPRSFNPNDHLDATEIPAWRGLKIDVGRLYDALTSAGWKIDNEESNLMVAFSKTWRAEGIKVWLHLEKFVCAPPYDEVEQVEQLRFYRFDPAAMPAGSMYARIYDPGDEDQDWFPGHREEWDWLIENGDPEWNTFELLTPIALREVPASIRAEVWAEIEAGLVVVD